MSHRVSPSTTVYVEGSGVGVGGPSAPVMDGARVGSGSTETYIDSDDGLADGSVGRIEIARDVPKQQVRVPPFLIHGAPPPKALHIIHPKGCFGNEITR